MLTDNDLPYMYNAGSLVNGAKHEGPDCLSGPSRLAFN